MRKFLFLAFGIALEMSAQTDVYTGRPCIGPKVGAKYAYNIVNDKTGHSILEQVLGWGDPTATEGGENGYFRAKMSSLHGTEEYKDMSWLYRQEGSKVYFYDDEKKKDILLFDFGLKAGDIYQREYNDFTVKAEVIAVYDTILTETYNGEAYKGKAIKLQGKAPNTWFHDTWVEGIGSIYTGLYPTWKAYPSEVFLLTYDRENNDYVGRVRFFPDCPGLLITKKMTTVTGRTSDEYKQYVETYGYKDTYEFRGDTLCVRWIWSKNCEDDDYIACLIQDDDQGKCISFAHPECLILATCYSTCLIEMKFSGFEQGVYTICNDTTLVCKGAEVPDTAIEINEVNFPDEYFRNYLLSRPYGQDGVLTAEELKGIKDIRLYPDNTADAADVMPKIPLRSLMGLEFFTELEVLNCHHGLLTELNLTSNNKLRELDCMGNELTELDLSQNRNLTYVNCALNKLEEINLANNEALTTFKGDNNPFHGALDFSHQQNLKTLFISDCNLSSLDLSQCPALRSLSCYHNQLESLILNPDANVGNDLFIYSNCLSEKAMLDFINSLHPNTTSDPSMYRLYAMDFADREKNECTEKVIKAANERGWTIYDTNGKIYIATEEEEYAYRPFVEEGKVWRLGFYRNGADPTTEGPLKKEYHYLQGDTVINGQACLRCMIREERRGGAQRTRNAGGAYEEDGVVNILAKNPPYYPSQYLFYPFYSFLEETNKEFALYDATVPNDGYISRFIIDKTYYQDTDTYKGSCIDVSPAKSRQDTITWYQGVGYMGFYNLPQGETDGKWKLMACVVDDEVLYYDATLMDWDLSSEAKKKKLDFTHVIKAQPHAPRHRAQQQEGDGTLKGEYSDREMFVRLNALMGDYTATLTDASGQVVYRKTVQTDNVLALNTALTAYGPGDYVLTLENDEEAYTATLNIEPNGISPTPSPARNGGEVYDLQGRRLQKAPEKGLYIQDGKIKTHPQPLP